MKLENYAKTEEAKVEELIKAVAESGAKVIVSGAAVGDMALHFCERYKYISFFYRGNIIHFLFGVCFFFINSYEFSRFTVVLPCVNFALLVPFCYLFFLSNILHCTFNRTYESRNATEIGPSF